MKKRAGTTNENANWAGIMLKALRGLITEWGARGTILLPNRGRCILPEKMVPRQGLLLTGSPSRRRKTSFQNPQRNEKTKERNMVRPEPI